MLKNTLENYKWYIIYHSSIRFSLSFLRSQDRQGGKMNKTDFLLEVKKVYKQQTGQTIHVYHLKRVYKAMVQAAINGLLRDGEFRLRDVLSLQIRRYNRRTGFNPDSQKRFIYTPKNGIFAKVGKKFIDAVNSY